MDLTFGVQHRWTDIVIHYTYETPPVLRRALTRFPLRPNLALGPGRKRLCELLCPLSLELLNFPDAPGRATELSYEVTTLGYVAPLRRRF